MEYVLVFMEENHYISDTAAKLNKNEFGGEKVSIPIRIWAVWLLIWMDDCGASGVTARLG